MVRQINNKVEITEALSLIWETFLQFEAPDYSNEGVKSFQDFIENEDIVAFIGYGRLKNEYKVISSHRKEVDEVLVDFTNGGGKTL